MSSLSVFKTRSLVKLKFRKYDKIRAGTKVFEEEPAPFFKDDECTEMSFDIHVLFSEW
jgi:hypothetical protein